MHGTILNCGWAWPDWLPRNCTAGVPQQKEIVLVGDTLVVGMQRVKVPYEALAYKALGGKKHQLMNAVE